MADLDAILRRLERLETERAILATLHRYGHSIDYGLEADWLDCFTPDGAFDMRRRTGPDKSARHEGHTALASFIAKHTRAPAKYHKHLVIEPVIAIDGDQAKVESFFARLDADSGGAPFIRAFGRYKDTMVKGQDGKWRFRERIAEVESQVAQLMETIR